MAPPKRKTTGGRVTPKGGPINPSVSSTTTHAVGARAGEIKNSSRYTAPHAEHYNESPPWLIWLMAILLIGGIVVLLTRYFGWDSNVPTLLGLGLLLAGLFVATKWK